MFTVSRPFARSEHQVGDLAQAGAIIASICCMERMDPASKLQMSLAGWNCRCEGAGRGKPRLQMVIVRQVETQRDLPGQYGANDDVEPNGHVVPIDQ